MTLPLSAYIEMPDKTLLQFVQPLSDLPNIADQKKGKKLLVIGSASCVWEDLQRVRLQEFELMAINDMMMHYPGRLDHGATCHPDKLPGWGFFQAYEASKRAWQPMETHSHLKHEWVKYHWPIHREGGTSGLFGVTLGLLMDYDLIVLAGIPCDSSPRYFDPPWQEHLQFGRETVFRAWEEANAAIFHGKVKSLSGKTRELLGEPT